ncbi:DoxX family protein [Pelagerythrobacter marinus]|jgi:uncharacterized membrane protein|nr:DoxX family protein [Pelagerythrobacter marinus]USA39868.1 DoxX family protein [Pelagerythrobacter marinus]WPZ06001.1 DoxX family protein [Pelagerythrobacter marinus]
MFFLALMATLSGVALVWSVVRAAPLCWRSVMRYGMAGAFLFTGFDHFLSLETRYLPMIPPYLGPFGRELVIASGVAELAGAIGLLLPRAAWSRLRLPDMRPVAGVGLALLLSVTVLANAHVAEAGLEVQGLSAGQTYAAIRPLLQPIFILWALVCSEAIFPPRRSARTS